MRRLVLTLVLAAATAAPAAAQISFGPQGSWGDESDFGIGARLQVPLADVITTQPGSAANDLFLIGSFDWFFPDLDGVDYWEINANAGYRLQLEELRPYVGAGLNFARIDIDAIDEGETEVGFNVLGGLSFLLGALDAFTEARFELGGGEQFVFTFGVLFGGS